MDDSTSTAIRSALTRAVFFALAAIGFSLALVPFIAASHAADAAAGASEKLIIVGTR